jgi:GTP-binding protein
VDLPGYGYAKISKEQRSGWQKVIESYLKNNLELKLVFLLIDSRHLVMDNDKIMIEWLNHYRIPYILILTKSDKISNNQYMVMSSKLSIEYPNHEIVRFSSKNKTGREDILKLLEQVIQ